MRVVSVAAGLLCCSVVLLIAIQNWPYVRGEMKDRVTARNLHIAKQEVAMFGAKVRGETRFNSVQLYAQDRLGVVLILEGSVHCSNDLVDLKKLVDLEKLTTPVNWKIVVSTNTPAKEKEGAKN